MTAPPARVTLATILTRSDEVLFQEVGGEAVLLNLDSQHYYVLNKTGRHAWLQIDGERDLDEIVSSLSEVHPSVPAAELSSDVLILAGQLLEAGLVKY